MYRGVLSEHDYLLDFKDLTSLNPLCIVECFRRTNKRLIALEEKVLIHCVSWSAFGAKVKTLIESTNIGS